MEMASSSGLSFALDGGTEVIVAAATGSGALGIIRLSGERTREVCARVCPELSFERPWRAQLCWVVAAGERLERAVVVPYRNPSSYTGEDMAEITVHGSPWLMAEVVEACLGAGARCARPGEFTWRAVANGKMDLVQAEGVRDLVRAETAWQAKLAREQLHGELSARFGGLREEVLGLLGAVEASLDFEDQGVVVETTEIGSRREALAEELRRLADTAEAADRLRGGLRLAILGPPNAGKSTLFNWLVGRERAIVAAQPGTTRDVLEAAVEIEGVRVTVVDAAGLRESRDEVESEGVLRALEEGRRADLVVWLQPADGPIGKAPDGLGEVLEVVSKADLNGKEKGGRMAVSVHRNLGLDGLRVMIAGQVREMVAGARSEGVTRRQAEGLRTAAACLDGSGEDSRELVAEDLRAAARHLGEVIGEVSSEDVLAAVFRGFCIGK